jgi:hypothetical protein
MTTATSGELAAAILAAQQATAAEVIAIDALTVSSNTLVQRITDDADGWDGAITDLAAQVTATNNLDNTSDADKPVSTAQQTALDLKATTTNIFTVNNQPITGAGGGNVDIIITSVSSISTSYVDRAELRDDPNPANAVNDTRGVEGLGRFVWKSTTVEPDDDETCFTSSTGLGQWDLDVPSYDLIQAHDLPAQSLQNELAEDEAIRHATY